MPMLPRTPTPFAPAGAEKDRTATDGSRAHIKWPAAAAHKARAARPPPRTPPYMPMLPRTPTPFAPAGAENVRRSGKPARRVLPRARRIHADDAAFVPRAAILRPARAQRALKKYMPQPMVRAHIKSSTAAAAQSPRGASSPAHAAYTPMLPRTPSPFTPAGAEKAHAAADGSGAYQMADRRSGKHARRVIPCARRIHADDAAFVPRAAILRPFTPAGAENVRRSGKHTPRIIPRARRIHADAAAFVPRAAILRPFTPAGAEKAHAAADGSGTYQMADRRRSAKHARRVLPRARRIHADDAAFVPRAAILRPPSRQRALKKHMPQPMVRAHIKWPTAAAERARRASSLRPPSRQPAQQQVPQAGGGGLRRRGLRRFDHAHLVRRGVGCAAAAARCASAPVSVPESVACG